MNVTNAQFTIGQVVRHRVYPFRGVIIDVDPEYAIPEDQRPPKDQPFYHLIAENESQGYHAYVSEQNLLQDKSGEPLQNPEVAEVFGDFLGDHYELPASYRN